MTVEIIPNQLRGSVTAPPSKSETHRGLICAALSAGARRIDNPALCDDTMATVRCLEALGSRVIFGEKSAYVEPIIKPQSIRELNCGESASTFRFLLPVAAALGVSARFICARGLAERPMRPIFDCLRSCGVNVAAQCGATEISGKLNCNVPEIDSSLSSQFLSGLLFAARVLGKGSGVRIKGALASPGYVDMTLDMLRKTGADFTESGGEYVLSDVSENTCSIRIGGDWSGAAALLCAAACGGNITVCGLDADSLQPDRKIADILSCFGAKIYIYNNSITVCGGELRAAQIDAADFPDLVPPLCSVAALAGGVSVIYNAGRLRYKETDRLACVAAALSDIGADIRVADNSLIINGKGELAGGRTHCFGDHRIVMALAAASCGCKTGVTIDGFDAVSKSYPDFAADFLSLGGVINVV